MLDSLKKAAWICAPTKDETPPVFRRVLNLDFVPSSARIAVTVMGIYDIYINGVRVGEDYYNPGWTMYQKRLQYQVYDVAEYLKEGENIIDITVAPGWCVGTSGWLWRKRVWSSREALLCYMEILGSAGEKVKVYTDEQWFVGEGPIRRTEFFFGENYDARREVNNFKKPMRLCLKYSNLVPHEGAPIRMTESIKPIGVIHAPNGETVIDFGQNLAGFVEFEIDAEDGEEICFDHGEELDAEGNFYNANYRGATTLVKYICKKGYQKYHPRFAFQGFRYIRLINWPRKMESLEDAGCFTAHVLHSQMKRTGHFECSDELVNRLFENIIWSQRSNFIDVPTDCPQRSERMGWTGDAQVFARAASYNYDVDRFFRKWLKDLAASQFPDGGVPIVVPDLSQPRTTSAGWSDAAVIIPWQMYLTYGDKQVLEDQFESMCGWIEYMRSQGEEECIWDTGMQYGDWLAMDAPCPWEVEFDNVEYTGATHPHLISTAYFAYSTQLCAKAGRVLGYDMSEYEQLHKRIKDKFAEIFYDGEMLVSDTQTAWVIGLQFDLLKDREFGIKRLAKLVRENGNRLTTGFIGTPYLLHALSDNGEEELAYTLLLQQEFPSWLYAVKQGATTIWEHWDSKRPDGSMCGEDMNSFNHYCYGSIADWMYQTAAGIAPTEEAPGFKHIRFAPKPDSRLGYCKASIDTRNGKVCGGWKREGEKIIYNLEVPVGCTAEVHLNGKVEQVGEGSYEFF